MPLDPRVSERGHALSAFGPAPYPANGMERRRPRIVGGGWQTWSMTDPLSPFSEPTATWFRDVFSSPTAAQAEAWSSIAQRKHTLVVAPTGSGKTLAAFLWALDHVATHPLPQRRTRIVYVSPLKALGVDVERNLRAPLVGIRRTAERLGQQVGDVTVGVRSGDTTARERSALRRRPPDVLITTPESLYLMLTSSAQETLSDVECVIIDEIHAIAGTKRGTHLALSMERLDRLAGHDVQRIALSATVRPLDRVAAFLGGERPVNIVAPPARKQWDVHTRLPVTDITDPDATASRPAGDPLLTGAATDTLVSPDQTGSLWPSVEREVYDTVMAGRSTLIFSNSRRTAERLTARLNEIWAEEHDPDSLAPLARRPPAQVMASSDEVGAAPAVIARAHHGSVSKQAREEIEAALKSGELRCVVATSSLELGIDMGAVDRVIQISAPPSVASALQRIGRAGHAVGEVSRGDVYPMHRADLVASSVALERMLSGQIEELKIPRTPLDVLAQHTVSAAVAAGDAGLEIEEWFETVRRSLPYAALERQAFEAVIELLTGSYPSADFAELRARLIEGDGRLYARPGALRLAVTSGGTIPDRGMFGVFLAGAESGARRVGELDEEMVYESRVGDVFTLGASSWRIQEINRDQVLVTPAPGHTGRLPFWRGDQEPRPIELGRALGQFNRETLKDPARLEQPFIDANTRTNIRRFLTEQRDATGAVPDDRTVVLERFRDEVGDWRFVVHSPLGRGVLGPWALAIGDAIAARSGVEVNPVASDDGIIWRMPDSAAADEVAELILIDPADIQRIVTEQVTTTSLFAGRFRECAARALLLPRRDPGRRAPLWQQRQRASQLLEVARHHPRFPIIIETIREVLQDVYDVPALTGVLQELQRGSVRIVEVTTPEPSPMAASMLFRYTGAFLYETDSPLAERRAATLSMDPALLASVLGTLDLRDVLDPSLLSEVQADLQHLAPERRARDLEEFVDLPRILGPILLDALAARLAPALLQVPLSELLAQAAPRAVVITIGGREHLASATDLGLLRDALGIPLPPGATAPINEGRDPLTQLCARFARTHAPFTASQLADAFALGTAAAELVLQRESHERRLIAGHFTPGVTETEYCDPEVLRRIRSQALAAARAQVEPISATALARFLASWHHTDDRPLSNADEVLFVLQRLAGAALPASAWESQILPARLRDYSPSHLDELIAEGAVVIRLRGAVGPADPLLALVPAEDLDLLPPAQPGPEHLDLTRELHAAGGTYTLLQQHRSSHAGLAEELWAAAEAGAIAPASMAPIRARIGTRAAHKQQRATPRHRPRLPRPGRALLARPAADLAPPSVAGRWYPVDDPEISPEQEAITRISAWLERHGVITRGVVEEYPGGFAALYRVLSELEHSGKVLRSYVVESLGGAQFATTATIDAIRAFADSPDAARWPSGAQHPRPQVLAAMDPANPYGAVLPWPEHPTARPSRSAGALVVVADGVCLAHLTRGGRTLSLFAPGWADAAPREDRLRMVAAALVSAAGEARMARVRIEEIDGERVSAQDATVMREAGARLTPNGVSIGA